VWNSALSTGLQQTTLEYASIQKALERRAATEHPQQICNSVFDTAELHTADLLGVNRRRYLIQG